MSEQPFAVTDLLESVLGDHGPETIRRLSSRFDELQVMIRSRVDGGVPAEQYEKYKAVSEALAAARSLIVMLSSLTARGAHSL